MWKVLIADDNYPVLEFIERIIPWDDLNMNLIGMYENGMEALEHCTEEMPHLLITDIGMPGMDGMELIRRLKTINPQLKVVILSCHDEFHLAQQAIKLNVDEYILKETMQPEDMVSLMEVLRSGLESHKDMMRSTLSEHIFDPRFWESAAYRFGIDWKKHAYWPVLCYANRYRGNKQRFQTEELFSYVLGNGIHESIDVRNHGVSFRSGRNEIILLIPELAEPNGSGVERLKRLLRHIQSEIRTCMKIELSFIYEKASADPQEIMRRLKGMLESPDQRFYSVSGSLSQREEFVCSREDIYQYYSHTLDEFKALIVKGSAEEIEAALRQWENWIRGGRFSAETVKGMAIKVLSDIELKYRAIQSFQSIYSTEMFHHTLRDIESLEELITYTVEFLLEKVRLAAMLPFGKQRKEIIEAQNYVKTNLNKKIVMEEVAKMLHMNASHFSRLFKQESGETFIEFVTKTKMEHAKQYLLQTDKSVDQIAVMLGYDNTSYFIKVFKSFCGMSPLHYKREK